MTVRGPGARKRPAAPKKAAPKKTTRPNPEQRIAALEASNHELRQQVAQLGAQVNNIAQFIAAGVAQQLQAQLGQSPELAAALAAAQQQAAG